MSDYQGNIIIKNPATPTGPATTGRAPGMWKLSEVAYWIKQGVWPDPAIVPDQYFPYVSLLLSTTSLGNANNNLFVDSSGAFNPVSRNGNTTQGSFTPYSTNWSNYFDGSGDYLTLPSNAALEISSGDFTIEAWVYKASNGNYQSIYSNWNDSNSGGVLFCVTGLTPELVWRPFNIATAMVSGPAITANTWTHVAVVRNGNVFTVYTNGVAGTPVTYSTNATAAQTYQVGAYAAGASGNFNGYMSNVRVVKGTAVYTSNFTPSTTPLTAISGTSLLTCQSNRFRDASTNNFTITVAGNTSVTDFGPFSPSTYAPIAYNQSDITNWSGYFDGNGDYGRITGSQTALQFGTGTFTIEGWVYSSGATGTYQHIITGGSSWTSGSGGVYWYYNGGAPYLGAAWNGFAAPIQSGTLAINTWHHFALVRVSNTLTLYINGSSVSTLDVTGYNLAVNNQSQTNIGGGGWDQDFGGYLSNLRVVKGAAVYTSNFTPPTTNLTAISGTSLLTLQNAAFTDNSTNNFVITPYGNATVTGNSPFNTVGYWSNYFDGSTSRMSVADNAAFGFGTNNFTVEFWLNYTGGNGYKFFFVNNSGSGNYVGYGLQNGTLTPWVWNNGDVLVASSNITQNTWQHHALVRNGSTLTIYLNGTAIGSTTWTTDLGSSRPFYIGWNGGNNSQTTQGNISNFRVVKGTAVYTANFTPPTSPLTAITNTSLLTCQNGRFIDNSTNNFAVTVSGTTTIQSFDPFYTATIASNGGSMYFDGNGDYLQVPRAANLLPGTNDFTLEAWVYPTTTGTTQFIMGFLEQGVSGDWSMFRYTNDTLGIYTQVNGDSFGGVIARNQWNHVALSRVSGTLYKCVNGSATTVSWTGTLNSNLGYNLTIGADNAGDENFFTGWMYGTRIINGTGLYSSTTYTVPTTPFTPTANTSFLLNGMNAGIYDATTINDLETVGNAQVTTAVSKYGGSSVYFDGSGDYLVSRGNTILLGSGNFTVEFWVYFNAVNNGTVKYLYDFRTASATSASFLAQEASNAWTYWNGAGSSVTTGLSGSTFATGQWYHVAITRSSNVLYCFVNGTKVSSDPADSSNYASATMTLGARYSGSDGLNGYIDDVRLTAGVARYTSNFTPPTQAFPVY